MIDRVERVKPTMPMQAFPPGTPPRYPPGYPPPGYSPPGAYGHGPPPGPQPSRSRMWIGLGCGCVALLGATIIASVYFASDGFSNLFGPGDEVASTQVPLNQNFALAYQQVGSQKYEVWLEIDLECSGAYQLSGPILLSEDGAPFGQYTIDEDGNGSPVMERDRTRRVDWESRRGNVTGMVSLFPIPARTPNANVALAGTVTAPPGTTGTVRLFVAKRD